MEKKRRGSFITSNGIRHIDTIRVWQKANGGFRRLPPRDYDEKLSNWVAFCRTAYRRGNLAVTTSKLLIDLGISLDAAIHGIQPMPLVYDRAQTAITKLHEMNAENDLNADAAWLKVEFLTVWIKEMRDFGSRRPGCPLFADLKRFIPNVFEAFILESLGSKIVKASNKRGTDATLLQIIEFKKINDLLPSILSADKNERNLASWLIRWEHELMGSKAHCNERSETQNELGLVVNNLLKNELFINRRSEWHWWSSCAMIVLKNKNVGNRWHHLIWTPKPLSWYSKLNINKNMPWISQTALDAVDMKIEESWRVAVAIESAMDESANEYALKKNARKSSEQQ